KSWTTSSGAVSISWISPLLGDWTARKFHLVPRGLLKGTGPRFHQGHRSPGAQPEIASKAVREDIEDRLHGQAAELRSCGRARRQVARVVSLPAASGPVRPAYSSRMADPLPADDALMASLAARDLSALAALYDRYGRLAYALAYRILGESEAAEDVVQDAYISAWRGAQTSRRERGNPRGWLLSIVHHRAVDVLRRKTTFRPAPLEAAEHKAAD